MYRMFRINSYTLLDENKAFSLYNEIIRNKGGRIWF